MLTTSGERQGWAKRSLDLRLPGAVRLEARGLENGRQDLNLSLKATEGPLKDAEVFWENSSGHCM